MRRLTVPILLLAAVPLCACSSRPISDPLGILDMMERCEEMAKKGEKPWDVPPFLPILGCR
jgi:hypothetical protein